MRRCWICSRDWSDETRFCPADGIPIELGRASQRLFADPYRYYYGGSGGLDWMETTLAQLNEILALAPSHSDAIGLKNSIDLQLAAALPKAAELVRQAEAACARGDVLRCIQLLVDNRLTLRKTEVGALRQRARQHIRSGAPTPPASEDALRLARSLFNEVDGYYIEGIGGIDWAEGVWEGIEEVLFLDPTYQPAIRFKDHFRPAIATMREDAENGFRLANGRFALEDLPGCVEALSASGLRIRRTQAVDLLQRLEEEVSRRMASATDRAETNRLLERVRTLQKLRNMA